MNYSVPLDTLPSLVKEFASYKSAIQNASEKTISEYLLDLRTFFRFMKCHRLMDSFENFEQIDCSDITVDFIRDILLDDLFKHVVDKVEGLYTHWFLGELGNNWSDVCADELETYGKVLEVPQQEDFYRSA